jgi:hypothetical protein
MFSGAESDPPPREHDMNTPLTRETLARALDHTATPCLSLYQPTHRHHPDNGQDPIRFRNLVKDLEASLRKSMTEEEVAPLLKPFEALARRESFWQHTLDGLAVLAAPGYFDVFVLQRPVPEVAIVADNFHTKPLRRLLQSLDRYQVLGVTRQRIRLFEGNRDTIDEVPLHPDVPATITDALGEELTDPHLTVASYGGVGSGASDMRHGHGSKKDEVNVDTERFFRVIDRAILEHHSRPSGLPLVLAALAEHHDRFRKVTHNPQLVDKAIAINPEGVSADVLRERAWEVMQPRYQARIDALGETFGRARAKGLASDDLEEVGAAIAAGRVGTLLVDADRKIGGHFDETSGAIVPGELTNPHIDDVLDDLAEHVEKRNGEAFVLPAAQMPSDTGVAAIFRF